MEHLNDLQWSQLLGGDAGFFATRHLRRHLRACNACAAKETVLKRERTAFEADPRFNAVVDRLVAKAPREEGFNWSWFGPPMALSGVVALMLIITSVALFYSMPKPSAGRGDLEAKGADLFSLTVHRGDQNLPFGGACRAGDAVRATYQSAAPYLTILGEDGSGKSQQLFAGPIAGKGDTPGSWVLDSAPGKQCFTAVFSEAPSDPRANAGAKMITRCCEKEAK